MRDCGTRRAYIEVRPETTEQDVRSAYRMLAAAHEKRPKSGRPGRNPLAAMECAGLHDRCGWTYERIAEHCGWHDYTAVSKYVAEGRKILEGTGQN